MLKSGFYDCHKFACTQRSPAASLDLSPCLWSDSWCHSETHRQRRVLITERFGSFDIRWATLTNLARLWEWDASLNERAARVEQQSLLNN